MATPINELNAADRVFLDSLYLQGGIVTVSEDLLTVTIDGQASGTFESQKLVFAAEFDAATTSVAEAVTKTSGVLYKGISCGATDADCVSVSSTITLMGAIADQTAVPIRFSNGNTLVLDDDEDLASFLAVWQPFRFENSPNAGYSFSSENF